MVGGKGTQGFVGVNLKERGVDVRMILKCIFKE